MMLIIFLFNFNPLIWEMVNSCSQETIFYNVLRLQNFQTRYSLSESAFSCSQFLYNKLVEYHVDSVFFQNFQVGYSPNVIGIKKGTSQLDSIYVVLCAHYDAISNNPPYLFAPGADDNGSGTATLLEVIRILSNYNFEKTIRFIFFSGEEQGFLGSYYYCSVAKYIHQDSIISAINIDMIGYSLPARDSASVIGKPNNPNCQPLVDYFISCADTYTNLKCIRTIIDRPRSDHASFNRFGYIAIQIRENLNINNPYYHTTGDTIGAGFNDLNLVYEITKAAIATIASLSNPISSVILPIAKNTIYNNRNNIRIAYNPLGQKVNSLRKKGMYFLKDNRQFKKVVILK
ncbi:MAG: M20/M25/M40 family metallo-hydrolase [candidate division WOR-3 bacterium]